jgi:hypothetical protein
MSNSVIPYEDDTISKIAEAIQDFNFTFSHFISVDDRGEVVVEIFFHNRSENTSYLVDFEVDAVSDKIEYNLYSEALTTVFFSYYSDRIHEEYFDYRAQPMIVLEALNAKAKEIIKAGKIYRDNLKIDRETLLKEWEENTRAGLLKQLREGICSILRRDASHLITDEDLDQIIREIKTEYLVNC